jgi:uncharacterized protein (TIGR02421 family)
MKLRKEIRNADSILSTCTIPLSLVNPINEASAKKSFFSGKTKNPVLEYNPPLKELLELRRKIFSINIDEIDAQDSLINEKQALMIRKIDMINSIGCIDFTEKSIKVYGLPDKDTINKAYEIVQKKIKNRKAKKVLSKSAVDIIKANLKQFRLNYKVKRADIITSCAVCYEKKIIKLKKKERFSQDFINRLIVHEIGTHVFRYENGLRQKLKILAKGINYYENEEGLAAYNEERFGVLNESFLKNYAGRVIAVSNAQMFDFHRTFRELRRFFDKKTAFQLTMRAKRGIANTAFPGGFTKDYLYLKGYYKIKNYAERGGDINELYYGKINTDDVLLLKNFGLAKPKLIPKDFILF